MKECGDEGALCGGEAEEADRASQAVMRSYHLHTWAGCVPERLSLLKLIVKHWSSHMDSFSFRFLG